MDKDSKKIEEQDDDDDDDSGWDTDLDTDEVEEVSHSLHKTNKEIYTAACKEYGVIPASYFLRNMENVRLNMAHHGFGIKGIKALSVALITNTHLTALDLSDNGLGFEGVYDLCQMLLENCYITELDISENNIGIQGVEYICGILDQTDTLKRLSLRGNSLDTKSSIIICEVLEHNTSLRYLNVSHNLFGEEAGLHFRTAIAINEYLEEIDLSWNHLRQKGACAIAKSLKENTTLKNLNLSWNGFGDDGIYVLSESLKYNTSLQQLNISSNRITHLGALHLQKCLAVNEGLIVLKVGQNPLQHGAICVLQGVKANTNTLLAEVDLSDVQVTREFMDLSKKLCEGNEELRVYHGGLGGSPQKASERPKPMKVLRDYIKGNQMRVFDLFKKLDKDKSMSISIPEFVQGLRDTGVPLRHDELFQLVKSLDLDGDGEINYKEFLTGHQEVQKEERDTFLKDKADKERRKKLSMNLQPSTPSSGSRSPRISVVSRENSRPNSRSSSRPVSPGQRFTNEGRRSRSNTSGVDESSYLRMNRIPPSTAPAKKISVGVRDEKPPGTAPNKIDRLVVE